jgi:hypothetical protein
MLAFSTLVVAFITAIPAFASPVERADAVPLNGQVRQPIYGLFPHLYAKHHLLLVVRWLRMDGLDHLCDRRQ